jgi:flagellar motility protein MotE (MotC chaperone)
MKKLGALWSLFSAICVLVVIALIVAVLSMRSSGALSRERLDLMARVMKGEKLYAERTDNEELARSISEFEERQRLWGQQTLRREEDLKNLAAVVAKDLESVREAEAKLKTDREKFEKDRTEWESARGPQQESEETAARRRTFKSIRDMAPPDQVAVLVRLPPPELVEMMKLYKGEAGTIWPLLQKHPEMDRELVPGATPRRTRFDVVWEEFNKPTPLPKTG